MNHCIFTLLLVTFLTFIKFTADTLSVVELLPIDPHPKVNDGVFTLYKSPIAPCVDGAFTKSLPVLTLFENSAITLSLFVCITAE